MFGVGQIYTTYLFSLYSDSNVMKSGSIISDLKKKNPSKFQIKCMLIGVTERTADSAAIPF